MISIHAPSRERLLSSLLTLTNNNISIHAPSRERPLSIGDESLAELFQSTLPRGSDLFICVSCFAIAHFNPRSLAGATPIILFCSCTKQISIHAPSRERLTVEQAADRVAWISIHAPSRERRMSHAVLIVYKVHFNPRSLAGATFMDSRACVCTLISIHAPSRERHPNNLNGTVFGSISIHAPSRERQSYHS